MKPDTTQILTPLLTNLVKGTYDTMRHCYEAFFWPSIYHLHATAKVVQEIFSRVEVFLWHSGSYYLKNFSVIGKLTRYNTYDNILYSIYNKGLSWFDMNEQTPVADLFTKFYISCLQCLIFDVHWLNRAALQPLSLQPTQLR